MVVQGGKAYFLVWTKRITANIHLEDQWAQIHPLGSSSLFLKKS